MATNPEPVQNEGENTDSALNPEEESKDLNQTNSDTSSELHKQDGKRKWRAKLYQLNMDGGWDDLGTGYSHVDTKK